jgi:hypothetical protein
MDHGTRISTSYDDTENAETFAQADDTGGVVQLVLVLRIEVM